MFYILWRLVSRSKLAVHLNKLTCVCMRGGESTISKLGIQVQLPLGKVGKWGKNYQCLFPRFPHLHHFPQGKWGKWGNGSSTQSWGHHSGANSAAPYRQTCFFNKTLISSVFFRHFCCCFLWKWKWRCIMVLGWYVVGSEWAHRVNR